MKKLSKQGKGLNARAVKMPGLYLRGKIFWYTKMTNGARMYTSLETEEEGEAVAKIMAIRKDPKLAPIETYRHEVDQYIRNQTAAGRLSAGLAPIRESTLLSFAAHCNIVSPSDVTVDKVRDWYNWMRRMKSPALRESTAQAYVFGLRAFLRWLVDRGQLRDNVALKVKLDERRANPRLVFCYGARVSALIKNAPNDSLRFILYCGFHAGMRKGEIIEARPDWFDLRAGCINIRETDTFIPKDRDARTVPLTADFQAFLSHYGRPSPYMLAPDVPYGSGKWLRYRYDFRKPFTDYIRAYGDSLEPKENLSWITPHIMRHTFASLHAGAGTSIYKIAKWLGDGVEVVQRHYAKLSPSDSDINKAFTIKKTRRKQTKR